MKPVPRNNPVLGAMYFLRGFALLTKPGVRLYAIIPLLINVTLFTLLIFFGASEIMALAERMLPDALDWMKWVLLPIFLVASLAVAFFSFNMVANLVAAPFNGLLAGAVERHLTGRGNETGSGWRKLLRELRHTLVSETRKLAYVLVRTVPLLVLFLVPMVNVVAALLWLLLGAWMLTITYADYAMANHGIGFTTQRALLARSRFLSLGFGGCVMAALAVPILNFVVIPCAVAGATAMWVEQLDGDDIPSTDGPAVSP